MKKKAAAGSPALPVYTVSFDGSGEKLPYLTQGSFEVRMVRFQRTLSSGSVVRLFTNEYNKLVELGAPIVPA